MEVCIAVILVLLSLGCITTDTEAPQIVSTQPSDSQTDVAPNSSLSIDFSEPVDPGSAEAAFSIYPALSGSFLWNQECTCMTYRPTDQMFEGELYNVTIAASLQDAAGNSMGESYTFSFRTWQATVSIQITGPEQATLNVTYVKRFRITIQNLARTAFEDILVSIAVPEGIHLETDGLDLGKTPGRWVYKLHTHLELEGTPFTEMRMNYTPVIDLGDDDSYEFKIIVQASSGELLLGRGVAIWTVTRPGSLPQGGLYARNQSLLESIAAQTINESVETRFSVKERLYRPEVVWHWYSVLLEVLKRQEYALDYGSIEDYAIFVYSVEGKEFQDRDTEGEILVMVVGHDLPARPGASKPHHFAGIYAFNITEELVGMGQHSFVTSYFQP